VTAGGVLRLGKRPVPQGTRRRSRKRAGEIQPWGRGTATRKGSAQRAMNFRFLLPDGDITQAERDVERALRRTLNSRTLPATPEESVTPGARRNPFWYRCMYMLTILAEGLRWSEEWTTRRIASVLALTLEEEVMSSLRYRRVPRILTEWRWCFLQNRLELAHFLERVEPEILVLVAGVFADGEEPLTLPAAAASRPDLRVGLPLRRRVIERIQRVVEAEPNKTADLELSAFLIGYAVRNLDSTPRGNYNLACYCSDGAARAPGEEERSRWIQASADYLFDSLTGLDAGMDAWAKVDLDLEELRIALGGDFDTLVQRADDVRTARFALSGWPEKIPRLG
jgi:hypothetical protein